MHRLRLLDAQPEVVTGLIISAEPPQKLCALFDPNGNEIDRATLQERKAVRWAKQTQKKLIDRIRTDEAKRLGYDRLELRIYEGA